MEETFFIILISDDSGSKNLLGFLMVHCIHLGRRSAINPKQVMFSKILVSLLLIKYKYVRTRPCDKRDFSISLSLCYILGVK